LIKIITFQKKSNVGNDTLFALCLLLKVILCLIFGFSRKTASARLAISAKSIHPEIAPKDNDYCLLTITDSHARESRITR